MALQKRLQLLASGAGRGELGFECRELGIRRLCNTTLKYLLGLAVAPPHFTFSHRAGPHCLAASFVGRALFGRHSGDALTLLLPATLNLPTLLGVFLGLQYGVGVLHPMPS